MPHQKRIQHPKKADIASVLGPSRPGRRAHPLWLHGMVVLGLLLANIGMYHRTTDLGFLSVDDPDYVQNNPYIEKFSGLNLKHILTTPYAANYAPANLLSYALDVALAGAKNASAIHLSNVMWHGWVVCMVYLLAYTIRAEMLTAAAAALLFLLHPVHVEVVVWISSRKDLVATGFAALSMASYLRYRDSPTRKRSYGWYAASWLSFLVASAGKQSVLLLPAVMLVWDILVERRRSWTMLADKLLFGLVTVFFGWMTWQAQPGTNQAPNAGVLAGTQLTNLWLLTGLGQHALYRPAPQAAAWSWIVRVGTMIGAAAAWGLPLLLRRRQPVRAALCYWALIQMVPPMLLNFVVPITDRYLFLPSVGVCLLAAMVAADAFSNLSRARWAGWTLLALLGAVWAAKTWSYVEEWRDPRSVWYGAHFKTNNPQVSQFLGEVYQNAGDRVDAFVKSGAALQVTNELRLARAVLGEPASVERLQAEWRGGTARTNSIAYRDKLWDLAWEQYEEALAHRGTLSTPNLFMTRGRLLVSRGKFRQAIPEFQNALRFAQASTYEVVRQETVIHALRAIGVACWNLRDYKAAQPWYLKAQEVQRKSGKPWISTLDEEAERLKSLAAGQQDGGK